MRYFLYSTQSASAAADICFHLWHYFDPYIINPSITTATNEEMLISAFQEKSFHQIFFWFGKYAQLGQPMTWLTFGSKQFQNCRLAAILNSRNFVIFTPKMQNSWIMIIKQNVRSHTMITHDKFCTNKIQNGRQSAIFNFFSHYLGNSHDSWYINFCFLILHIAITYHLGIFGDILIPIYNQPFNHQGHSQRNTRIFLFGKYAQQSQPMTWLTFGSKRF